MLLIYIVVLAGRTFESLQWVRFRIHRDAVTCSSRRDGGSGAIVLRPDRCHEVSKGHSYLVRRMARPKGGKSGAPNEKITITTE
jgi:hypothetical protein